MEELITLIKVIILAMSFVVIAIAFFVLPFFTFFIVIGGAYLMSKIVD